jgi:hypothetical protein
MKIRSGDKFRSTAGCDYLAIGTVLIAEGDYDGDEFNAMTPDGRVRTFIVGVSAERFVITLEAIKNKLKRSQEQVNEAQERIDYMEKHSMTELDEDRFFIHKTIEKIRNDEVSDGEIIDWLISTYNLKPLKDLDYTPPNKKSKRYVPRVLRGVTDSMPGEPPSAVDPIGSGRF